MRPHQRVISKPSHAARPSRRRLTGGRDAVAHIASLDDAFVLYLATAFVLYFLAQALPLHWQHALGGNPGLWPASAVGLVLILGAPEGKRWRVAMVTLAANLAAHIEAHAVVPNGIVAALGTRLLADWGGAELLARVLGPRPALERSGPLLKFVAIVGLLITPVVAFVGAVAITMTGGPPFGVAFMRWYVTEVVMTLLLAPALWVSLDGLTRLRATSWRELALGTLALLTLIVNEGAVIFVRLSVLVRVSTANAEAFV